MNKSEALLKSLQVTSRHIALLFLGCHALSLYIIQKVTFGTGFSILIEGGLRNVSWQFSMAVMPLFWPLLLSVLALIFVRLLKQQVQMVEKIQEDDASASFGAIPLQFFVPWLYSGDQRPGFGEKAMIWLTAWLPPLAVAYAYFALIFNFVLVRLSRVIALASAQSWTPFFWAFFISLPLVLLFVLICFSLLKHYPKDVQANISELQNKLRR